MKIPVKAVREFSKKHGLTHTILYGYDGKQQHVATWGHTIEACSQAADFGNKLKEALGWPESLQAQPSRVRKLQAEIKALKARLEEIENPPVDYEEE
jgi:hypothetical protein